MKIYLAAEMGGSPFSYVDSIEILKDFGCVIVNGISDADIIVAHSLKILLPAIIRYPKKKFLVWTNEPRFDTTFKSEIKFPFGFSQVCIMNVFGEDVFWHNYHFLASYHFNNGNNLGINVENSLQSLSKGMFSSLNKKNKIVALYTNSIQNNNKLIKNGVNIDLTNMRCQYAISGSKRNLIDIFGNKWPLGMAIDNSGFGFEKKRPWWLEKLEILNGYKFNLCFENTAHPYYVTEKMWHAIASYSLPIYTSFNSTIYEAFPKNSFVDASVFKDEHDLFDYIEGMSIDEYLERLNLCIDAFNSSIVIKRASYEINTYQVTKKIVDRLSKY